MNRSRKNEEQFRNAAASIRGKLRAAGLWGKIRLETGKKVALYIQEDAKEKRRRITTDYYEPLQ
jgi:hypothetical protein